MGTTDRAVADYVANARLGVAARKVNHGVKCFANKAELATTADKAGFQRWLADELRTGG